MPNLGPTTYEFRFGMYFRQSKLVGWITKLVWLIWLNVKSKWPIWLIVNHHGHLVRAIWLNLGHFDGPLDFLTICLFCCMVKKVILVKCFS